MAPNARLCAYLKPAVDQRLRLFAFVSGHKTLSKALTEVLDKALPSAEALAAQIRGDDTSEH